MIQLLENCVEQRADDSVLLILYSLYESFGIETPDCLYEIERKGLLLQYADEFICDLADIAQEEFNCIF
jgi:hypothetical protein